MKFLNDLQRWHLGSFSGLYFSVPMGTFSREIWRMSRQSYSSFRSFCLLSSSTSAEAAIKARIEAKTYNQIPQLITSMNDNWLDPNPFSFIDTFPQTRRIQLVDEMLQSFISLRPRSCLQTTYKLLLNYTLQSSNPLPLALAVLQRTLRSGCVPTSQTKLLLSSAWLVRQSQPQPISSPLLEMKSIGYSPDTSTCNYVLSSLSAANQLEEAVEVLKHMRQAGCIPNSESFGVVIAALCKEKRSGDAVALLKQMVVKVGLVPKQGVVMKVVATLRFRGEVWKAAGVIEFLEKEGISISSQSYESAVAGCIERQEYVLAGKVAMAMTDRGFLPCIRHRQKLVDGLVGMGEWQVACATRHKFAELGS